MINLICSGVEFNDQAVTSAVSNLLNKSLCRGALLLITATPGWQPIAFIEEIERSGPTIVEVG